MHIHHDHVGSHGHEHEHTHTHEHTHDGHTHEHEHCHHHDHDHDHPHTHEHLHDHGAEHHHSHDCSCGHDHHHHDHNCSCGHDHHHHDHGHCHSCGGHCEHSANEEMIALMKYMVNHNTAHAKELADLATKLQQAGNSMAYEQVMAAVSDFEKGNMRLSVILASLGG